MGVYGLPWTQLGYRYRYRGTSVLWYFFGTFLVLNTFVSLKPLQYGCLWTGLDPTRSLVPVPRYCGTFSVLNGTFSVLNSTFPVLLGWSA